MVRLEHIRLLLLNFPYIQDIVMGLSQQCLVAASKINVHAEIYSIDN